jgi:hypothetical protein
MRRDVEVLLNSTELKIVGIKLRVQSADGTPDTSVSV